MSNAKAALRLKRHAGKGMKIAIAVAAFNSEYTSKLLKSAGSRLRALGSKSKVVWVPGAFELGLAGKELASTNLYDAVICLGAVLRGETSHYDLVCDSAASGVLKAGMDTGIPVIFGVITCDTPQQALARCSGGDKDSGIHAADSAVHMAALLRSIRNGN